MKNFTKICLIIAACLGCLGAVFCITGFAMGADFSELSVWYDPDSRRFYTEENEMINAEIENHFSGIEKLEVDIAQADMTILEGESDEFVVRAANVGNRFTCKQDGRKLKIKESSKKRFLGFDFSGLRGKAVIVLEVPKDTILEELEADIGVGSLNVEGLHVKKLSSECGVGEFVFDGQIDGDCDLECGVGSMRLSVKGSAADFNYDLECGVGEITLGGSEFSGLGYERKINNGASRKMSLDCGVGSISIGFTENGDEDAKILDSNEQKREEYQRKLEEYEDKAKEYQELLDELDEME